MAQRATFQVEAISGDHAQELASEHSVTLPIEQTPAWYRFEQTFPDRTPLGFFAIYRDAEAIAVMALQEVKYHGFDFLWAKHGPVWLVSADVDLESQVVEAVVDWARSSYPKAAFIRLHTSEPVDGAMLPMQIVTYDRTVVIDLEGGAELILSRFSSKGRTNVRRSMKKFPVQISDETEAAIESFAPYYAVMAETAERQGFNAWGEDVYQNMIRGLGSDHVRIFAARDQGGELGGWSLVTISGPEATYYYAASNALGRSLRSPEQLVYGSAVALGDQGIEELDLMGIGSELSPSLNSLNSFKMKFAKEETLVAPAWDWPVNRLRYSALTALRSGTRTVRDLKDRLRGKSNETDE